MHPASAYLQRGMLSLSRCCSNDARRSRLLRRLWPLRSPPGLHLWDKQAVRFTITRTTDAGDSGTTSRTTARSRGGHWDRLSRPTRLKSSTAPSPRSPPFPIRHRPSLRCSWPVQACAPRVRHRGPHLWVHRIRLRGPSLLVLGHFVIRKQGAVQLGADLGLHRSKGRSTVGQAWLGCEASPAKGLAARANPRGETGRPSIWAMAPGRRDGRQNRSAQHMGFPCRTLIVASSSCSPASFLPPSLPRPCRRR
jgi:hypothetical protein